MKIMIIKTAGKLVLLWVFSTTLLYAETPVERSGDTVEGLELPKYKEEGQPEFKLPKISPINKGDSRSALRILVKKFEFTGNKVISDSEIQTIVAPYENRTISSSEIQEVRRNISLYYINKGFINSGALLPDQKVEDGIVKLLIVEGELTSIDLEGNNDLDSDYIEDRLKLGSGPPLNLKEMQDRLKIVQQDPLIKKVNAELTPGSKPGESILKVLVEESDPTSVVIFANNYRSPSVGGIGFGIEALHRNLTGNGDTISYRGTKTEGITDSALTENAISYTYPISHYDTKLKVRYEGSRTSVIEDPFSVLDITSKSDTFGIELTHPVYKTVDTDVVLGIGLDRKKSRSFLLGQPFPFSLGTEDGLSRVTALRLIQSYSTRGLNEAISARSVISIGIDAFDATIHDTASALVACGSIPEDECPDSEFMSWQGQLQYARRISLEDRQLNLILRSSFQLTDEPLLPAEQFSIGGARTVRGYRENQLVRDNGFVASVELRIPVFLNELGVSNVQIIPFFDYGRSWNEIRSTPEPKSITSAGLGVTWRPDEHLAMEMFAAHGFRNIKGESDDHDLQDSGLHFQISYKF